MLNLLFGEWYFYKIQNTYTGFFQDKKYLIICAADSPKQDLIQYLPQCHDFIHAARLRGGHVLIHW